MYMTLTQVTMQLVAYANCYLAEILQLLENISHHNNPIDTLQKFLLLFLCHLYSLGFCLLHGRLRHDYDMILWHLFLLF